MNKKDLNYIASLEKAISEKYGKEAAQDFRSEWSKEKEEEYLSQLQETNTDSPIKFEVIKQGDVLIKKRKKTTHCDRTCPVCKTYSFSSKDDLYMNRFKCCWLCYEDFVVGNESKWENQWRPNKDQLETALRRRK